MAKLNLTLAEQLGSKTAERFGLTTLPVDPRVIASKRDIAIESRDLSECMGCLIRRGDHFGILYASNLSNPGVINFTISHELGHYFLDGHAQDLFASGDGMHQSKGPFRSSDPREQEADRFAVGLLMPERPFVQAMRRAGNGLEAVRELAQLCQTSLTATAIRYATLAEDPVAVFVATGRSIDYCFLSKPLSEWRGVQWPRKGTPLPSAAEALRLNQEAIAAAHSMSDSSNFADWLDGAPDVECSEDVIGLGQFGQTLTMLWSSESLDRDDDEDNDSDDERY